MYLTPHRLALGLATSLTSPGLAPLSGEARVEATELARGGVGGERGGKRYPPGGQCPTPNCPRPPARSAAPGNTAAKDTCLACKTAAPRSRVLCNSTRRRWRRSASPAGSSSCFCCCCCFYCRTRSLSQMASSVQIRAASASPRRGRRRGGQELLARAHSHVPGPSPKGAAPP